MKFIQAIGTFLVILALCVVGFSVLFSLGWIWGLGLMWTANFGDFAVIVYIIGTICIIPAIAITHSILEE